jgi:superfamily I DNA/RNA helicase
MNLTQEQHDIINSTGNIKINAVAGSGKTTTIIEYARTRPKKSKILYLAFNRSVKLEAAKKFAEKGLDNVKVETAHSLAYRHIVFKHNYKVRAQGYKTHEMVELLGLQGGGEKHAEYIMASHISKLIACFCNSDKKSVLEINYTETITDPKAKTFVRTFHNYIEKQARLFLSKMDKGEIEITHDFYLKKFQLSEPLLHYDYILFDEGQDASPAMLDVFLKQKATKVIVGDTHQQIYGWRSAVNSLEKADFKTYYLSTSFRFSQDIANLAMEVLKFKNHLGAEKLISIIGKGKTNERKSKAILARTNLGLLLKAIEFVTGSKNVKHIYFEGNINSYTYADEGASLYDVLNLYNGKRHMIKDRLIQSMKDLGDLEVYIEKTEDAQLGMMIEIVNEYGNKIPGIIKTIKEKHVEGDDKSKAEMIFSTVHRSKGMEYDVVELVNDFMTEEKIMKLKSDKDKNLSKEKLNEEINMLYVAATRTKNQLIIPEDMMPDNFPESPDIIVLKNDPENDFDFDDDDDGSEEYYLEKEERKAWIRERLRMQEDDRRVKNFHIKTPLVKSYDVNEVRENHKDAYRPWTPELDDKLAEMYRENAAVKKLAEHFGRTAGAIRSRIKKLGLDDCLDKAG